MNENNTITIPIREYKDLLNIFVRAEAFCDFVQKENFVSRKDCGRFFGFEVSEDDD